MGISSYLPSTQFSLVLTSILLAGGLIWAADYSTSPSSPSTIAPVATPSTLADGGLDWKATLATIQGTNPTYTAPPSEEVVANLLAASETNNITNTIGRSILINLGEAKAQGLGSDIPTQEQIVENALSKLDTFEGELYTSSELTTTTDNPSTLRTYGNSVVTTLMLYPNASRERVLLAVGNALDSGSSSHLSELATLEQAYRNIANNLAQLSVPSTLTPLHLQVVNNFLKMASACKDMQAVLTDPLRGLAGLRTFQSLMQETSRLFISIAQTFERNGILFTEDEPGGTWNLLVAPAL